MDERRHKDQDILDLRAEIGKRDEQVRKDLQEHYKANALGDSVIIKKVDDYIKVNDEYHKKQDELREKDRELLVSMHKGLYGDKETGEQGLIKDMQPVLEGWRSVKWIFGFLLGLGGLALLAKNLFLK